MVKGEDKTSSIRSLRSDKYKPIIHISYKGSAIEYPYRKKDVRIFKDPKIVPIVDKLVFESDAEQFNVKEVQFFGKLSRIVFKNGYLKLAKTGDVKIVDSILNVPRASDCLDYLKQIATHVGLVMDGHNILASQYEGMNFVREDSVLAHYLQGGDLMKETPSPKSRLVYPFGFNLSQKKAVENAFQNQMSVIEGPPGTGKTQTILNIVANAVMRGESVAVVSSNNSAISNVQEKLEASGFGFIVALLGSSANRTAFLESQKGKLPEISDWKSDGKNLFNLERAEEELRLKLAKKNELAILKTDLDALQNEYVHFKEHYRDIEIDDDVSKTLARLRAGVELKFLAEIAVLQEELAQANRLRRFLLKLSFGLRHGLRALKLLEKPEPMIVAEGQNLHYKHSIDGFSRKISRLQEELDGFSLEKKMQECVAFSMVVFKAKLYEKYGKGGKRRRYDSGDLKLDPRSFVNDYPVVLSTTYSLRPSLKENFLYDYVIVDEASQVDLATGALALSCARKAVIVGDSKQLPNVVTEAHRQVADQIFKRFSLPEAYHYSNHSLLDSIVDLYPSVARVLLKEHYRCHPEIIGFCNQRFYNNELIVMTNAEGDSKPLAVYRTVKGNHARNHFNQRQIDVILEEVFPQQGLCSHDDSVGIVTPYRNQADALKKAFAGSRVKADTVDKFQGRERDVMIFSTVDNEIGDFASNPNRLNVAVSRAVEKFIIVTDGNENDAVSPIHDLIGYIQYQNHSVINSELHSVFDYLYKQYAEVRERVLKKYGRASEVESENLMYLLIKKVLLDEAYSKYDVVLHVPLRMLLKDLGRLRGRELEFARNPLSHVDFLIYSKLTHQPTLVVEVDGFIYHNTEKQKERDAVKDRILEKYNIPILRLSTIGSDEKPRLVAKLNALNGMM